MKAGINGLERINGYQLTAPWTTSGSAQWSFAEKGGSEWFIKRFLAPKRKRAEDGIPQSTVDTANARCDAFEKARQELYRRIREADNGNIVFVSDFFCYGSSYYAVSPRIPAAGLSVKGIAEQPQEKRILLMKILTYCVQSLHDHGVVHGDLKPANIILKRTATGGFTLKLIDFDAGFLEEEPRSGDRISFDTVYAAPETLLALEDDSIRLTNKIDIFALGLIFHEYACGRQPSLPTGCPSAVYAVLNGEVPQLNGDLPGWLRQLIARMLLPDPAQRPDAQTVFRRLQEQNAPGMENGNSFFHRPNPL